MSLPLYKVIFCDYINPKSDKSCEFIINGALVLKRYNNSYRIYDKGRRNKIEKSYASKKSIEWIDNSDLVAIPGLIDLHFHWVQDDVRQMPKDQLLTWLQNYTWPYENKFKSKLYTEKKAKKFTKELARVGTLGGACYGSIHEHSVTIALKHFIGDFVLGNVLMDMNSPSYLTQKASDALKIVKKLSSKFKTKYAVTPRFAVTTSPELMKDAMKIGKSNNSFMQTHLSENKGEIEFVLSHYRENYKAFKNVKNYTDIYKKCNVLGEKSIFGHGIHLSKEELKTLSKTKSIIAHCPTSNDKTKNLGLGSGLFDFRLAEKLKVRWGLGSDIGGGPFLSMLDVIQSFVAQNKKKKIAEATYIKGLFRATLANAQVLKIDKRVGSIDIKKEANLVFLEKTYSSNTSSAEEALQKIISSQKNNRANYDTLPKAVLYRGQIL